MRYNNSTGDIKLEAKDWESKCVLDLDEIKILPYRRRICFACQDAVSPHILRHLDPHFLPV